MSQLIGVTELLQGCHTVTFLPAPSQHPTLLDTDIADVVADAKQLHL